MDLSQCHMVTLDQDLTLIQQQLVTDSWVSDMDHYHQVDVRYNLDKYHHPKDKVHRDSFLVHFNKVKDHCHLHIQQFL